MTPEQKERINQIAKELGGKIEYLLCSDLHSQHNKIVITYNVKQK